MRCAFLPALVVLTVLLAGCSGDKKNPVKPGSGQPPAYSQATPQATLASLLTAYASRDSAEYRKLFAFDYQGFSYDVDTTALNQPGVFTLSDEMAHIKALAEDPMIIRIATNFGPTTSWIRHAFQGPNAETWAEIVIANPDLEIDTPMRTLLIPHDEVMTFRFSPDTSSASPTDTIWSVVRWYEDIQ